VLPVKGDINDNIDPGHRRYRYARAARGPAAARRLQAITGTLREHTSLRVTADYPMGPHYARTLAEWRGQFLAAADGISALGFGPAFQRMWNLYLAYSEAGFRAGYLDVHQLVLERRW
jgi:cyclopropane-fatty-acyl-phospholipid synthase